MPKVMPTVNVLAAIGERADADTAHEARLQAEQQEHRLDFEFNVAIRAAHAVETELDERLGIPPGSYVLEFDDMESGISHFLATLDFTEALGIVFILFAVATPTSDARGWVNQPILPGMRQSWALSVEIADDGGDDVKTPGQLLSLVHLAADPDERTFQWVRDGSPLHLGLIDGLGSPYDLTMGRTWPHPVNNEHYDQGVNVGQNLMRLLLDGARLLHW